MKNNFFRIFISLLFLVGFSLFFNACLNEKEKSVSLTNRQIQGLCLLGFEAESAELTADGSILVEGDILINPQKLENFIRTSELTKPDQDLIANDRQQVCSKTAAVGYIPSKFLTYGFVGEFTEEEKNAIRAGINMWETPLTSINFIEEDLQDDPLIVIHKREMPSDLYAVADFPLEDPFAGPGEDVSFDISNIDQICNEDLFVCIKNAAAHAIGHTIGFHHTNRTDFFHLLGSPTQDDPSIMNGGPTSVSDGSVYDFEDFTPANFWQLQGPSTNDLSMASALYPVEGLTLTINSVSITRFGHSGDQLFNVSFNYTQNHSIGRSYTAKIQLLQNGIVVKTVFRDIGVFQSGVTTSFVVDYGYYQARMFGVNYRGDYTQPIPSNTVSFFAW